MTQPKSLKNFETAKYKNDFLLQENFNFDHPTTSRDLIHIIRDQKNKKDREKIDHQLELFTTIKKRLDVLNELPNQQGGLDRFDALQNKNDFLSKIETIFMPHTKGRRPVEMDPNWVFELKFNKNRDNVSILIITSRKTIYELFDLPLNELLLAIDQFFKHYRLKI